MQRTGLVIVIVFGGLAAGCVTHSSVRDPNVRAATASSKRMPDGKRWTTANLNVAAGQSYCYEDAEPNCLRYGRLYTWETARQVCPLLGDGWRLPTNDEWRELAKLHGGLREEAAKARPL